VRLQQGEKAVCRRCNSLVALSPRFGPDAPLAFATAGLIFLIPAVLLPFVGASELGDKRISLLLTGVSSLWDGQLRALATLVLLCGAFLPFTLLIVLITLYGPEGFGRRTVGEQRLVRAAKILSRWSFPEVQVLAVLVGVVKLGSLVHLDLGPGFWCYCGMAVSLLAAVHGFKYSWPDPAEVAVARPRRSGGENAPLRCFGSEARSTCAALSIAAVFLLAPANLFPVLTTATSGNNRTDTIYSGAMALGQQGLWSLAAIVFTASILIPALKLAGLTCLLLSSAEKDSARARKLTRLYSTLAFIGRWSMLDVFLGAFLVGLVRFGEFATVRARGGLVAFAAVVILTVLATESFDPREIWLARFRTSPSPS